MWSDAIDQILIINTSDEIGKKRLLWSLWEILSFKMGKAKKYEAIKNNKNGATGLLHTMRILFDENQGQNILVFEDDIKFLRKDVDEVMERVMQQLPADYDLLYMGCNLLVPPVRKSENLLQIKSAYSSHAILYSAKGIDLILSLWDEEKPFDNFLMQKIQARGDCYCTDPMLCSQRKGVSQIFSYDPGRHPGIERYYDTGTGEMDWGLMMEDRFNEFTSNL